MHIVWPWVVQLSLAGVPALPSTVEWGLAAGSLATLLALPRIAQAKRSLSNNRSVDREDLRQEESLDGPERDAAAALSSIPKSILELFEDPNAIPVALPALLLLRSDDRHLLDATSHPQYAAPIRSLWNLLEGIEPRERVALIDKALRTLAACPPKQAKQVLKFLRELATAAGDARWQFHAWVQLAHDAVFAPRVPKRTKTFALTELLRELIELVSVVSVVAEDGSLAEYRFHRGWSYLELPHARALPADVLAFSDLEMALAKAAGTSPNMRARICNACTMALITGGSLDETQAAMIRLIRQRLGHPPFPVLPGKVLG